MNKQVKTIFSAKSILRSFRRFFSSRSFLRSDGVISAYRLLKKSLLLSCNCGPAQSDRQLLRKQNDRGALLLLFVTIIGLGFLCAKTCSAQQGPFPPEDYYRGLSYLNNGNLHEARAFYDDKLKNSFQIGPHRWIDAICYYTMLGESFYQAGNLHEALSCYNNAINLHIQYNQWLNRVTFTIGIQTQNRDRLPVPWGPGSRVTPLQFFPRYTLITLGDMLTRERINQGGVISSLQQTRIDPIEILRCLSLSMRRRIDILGPMVAYDELSPAILETFKVRSVTPTHWSVTWLDVLFGLALEGIGKKNEAADVFKAALLINGQFDHNLTATALFELGRINAGNNLLKEAAVFFLESSISAFQYNDPILQAEALRNYVGIKKILQPNTPDPIFAMAFEYFRQRAQAQPYVFATLSEEAIENLIHSGNTKDAIVSLKILERYIMSGRGLKKSRLASRWYYLQALAAYSALHIADGDASLTAMLQLCQTNSSLVYQHKLLDAIMHSGKISSSGLISLRNVSDLYETLLAPPDNTDWALEPMDALTADIIVPPGAYEQWFRLLVERDLKDKAFNVAEMTRAQRFFGSQPLGGRLSSLRYLVESPEKALPRDVRLNRENIFIRHPQIKELSGQAIAIKQELNKLPTAPEAGETLQSQKRLLDQLLQVSIMQEAQLRFVAACRLTIPKVFPPLRPLENIRANLKDDTSLLVFFEADQEMFGFMVTKKDLDFWRISSSSALRGAISSFLKSIGCNDGNRAILYKDLLSEKWREEGKKFLAAILGDASKGGARFTTVFKELVIVPDGVLWYLPFEALSVPAQQDGQTLSVPLILCKDLTIRYAPTANLALPGVLGRSSLAETTVIPGKLFSKESEQFTEAQRIRLAGSVQKMELLDPAVIQVPGSVLAPRLNRLINLNEIGNGSHPAGINWIPIPTAAEKNSNLISQWMQLPWGAPRLILFPGFRSAAENALKNDGNGLEFFLPIMQILSSGGETILISRWRTGGKTTYDLINSFMQNQSKMPNALAWKQAIEAIQTTDFVPAEEVRLNKPGVKQPLPKVVHPFFWSASLLIDSGEPIEKLIETPTTGAAEAPKAAVKNEPKPDEKMAAPNNSKGKEKKNTKAGKNNKAKADENLKVDGQSTPLPVDVDKQKTDNPAPADPNQMSDEKTDSNPANTEMNADKANPADSDNNDSEKGGVQPVVTIKETESTEKKGDNAGQTDKKTDTPATNTQSDKETVKEPDKEKKNVQKPSGKQSPVTDDQLKKEDEDADDFYEDD